MRIEKTESLRQAYAEPPLKGCDCRTVPLDELRRQLGLNLIEAARDQFGGNANVSLALYRR